MDATAEAALETQDPTDSLGEPEQEPTEAPDAEPSPDVDAAGESDEPAAAADADAAGQPDAEGAAADGPPRDEHGRFVSTKEAPAAEPAQPIAEASPPTPFAFRVDGRTVEAEGATVVDGQIRIPQDTWERVIVPRLADRGRHATQVNRLRQQIEEAKAERGEKEQRAEILLARVDELLSDRNKLVEFVNNYDREAPKLQLEVQNKILEQRLARTTKGVETNREAAINERLEREARPAIENAIRDLAQGVEGFDTKEAADFVERLWSRGRTPIFFRVQPNDPSGIEDDEIGVDVQLIAEVLEPMIEKAKKGAAEKKAAAVAQKNASALGKGPAKPKAPPTAPAAGSPTPGGEAKYPTTREEYLKWKEERAAALNLPA